MLNLPNTIKMIITDFDGVLTDNFVYINEISATTRRLNYKDVMGCFILMKNGINLAIISGEKNPAINWLSEALEIKDVHQKIRDKLPVLESIINKYNLTKEEFVYIGDDINDLECLNYAKYKITVPNAVNCIKEIDNIQITTAEGGNGAIREVADCLIKS